MVSCGIGGATVEQAQANVSYAEYIDWCRYVSQYGSLHMGMRIDRAVARALAQYFSAHSKGRFKIVDFSPFDAEQAKTDINDPFAVFEEMTGKPWHHSGH